MNSITLQGQIITQPELRYTSSDQTPICTSLLEYTQIVQGGEEAPVQVKVQGWGSRNAEALKAVEVGQQVVVTGSVRLNTVELEDGYKAKRAEVNISNLVVIG